MENNTMENTDTIVHITNQYSNGEISFEKYQQMVKNLKNHDPASVKKYIAGLKQHGNELIKIGKYENALNFYNKILDIEPEYTDVWNNKGIALKYLGRNDEANIWLDKYNTFLKGKERKNRIIIVCAGIIMIISVAAIVIPTISSEQKSPPKYQAGDIISNNSKNTFGLYIDSYDPQSDNYTFILKFNSATGWRTVIPIEIKEDKRVNIEEALPYKVITPIQTPINIQV